MQCFSTCFIPTFGAGYLSCDPLGAAFLSLPRRTRSPAAALLVGSARVSRFASPRVARPRLPLRRPGRSIPQCVMPTSFYSPAIRNESLPASRSGFSTATRLLWPTAVPASQRLCRFSSGTPLESRHRGAADGRPRHNRCLLRAALQLLYPRLFYS